jgi:hypothetical protein
MAADLLAQVRAEIDARLAELRPAVAEYERLLGASGALDSDSDADGDSDSDAATLAASAAAAAVAARESAASGGAAPARPARKRAASAGRRRGRAARAGASTRAKAAPRGAVEQAIAAALEHGSHTLGELVLVTAISAAEIREGLRRLQRAGAVTRARRDGRAAYALTGAA